MDDLPAVDTSGPAEMLRPKRRRVDIDHPPGNRRRAVCMRDIERRTGNRFISDAANMDVGLVRQVHQVVDHQTIVAFKTVKGTAFADPVGAVIPMEIRQLGRIREFGISRPHPDKTMPLDGRVCTDAGSRIDGFLRGHVGAASGGIEYEAVISADDLIVLETTHRKWKQPVPAGVFKCCYRTVSAAIKHYVLVANGAGHEFLLDLMAPSYGIPGVQWEWPCLGHGAPPVRFY